MSVQTISSSEAYLSHQRARFGMERGARLLKDCLLEDSNSCSSNGFKSFPRQPLLQPFPIKPKKEESKAIHRKTLQAVINAIKSLRFTAVKSAPSILPRSLSRRLSKKNGSNKVNQADIAVRVKDIVRWRSSRDLHQDVSPPSDFEPSTVNTTTTGSTTSGTPCSSWCDSDFTLEYLPSWGGKLEDLGEKDVGKENCEIGKEDLQCVGEDSSTETTAAIVADTNTQVGPEEDLQCDGDTDHNSPVSVLEVEYEEDDGGASDASLGTKQKLMQTIKRFETLAKITPFNLDEWESIDEDSCNGRAEEDISYNGDTCNSLDSGTEDEEEAGEVEEKAHQLWSQVKEGCAIWIHEERLIMDFFRDEVMKRLCLHHETYGDREFENQLVGKAKEWMRGERLTEIEHGSIEQRRKACLREIERGDWNGKQVKEEGEEVAVGIEDGLLDLLIDEMLTELYQW
ncbi:PREDICTED: uncharacterized protein LOC104801463 isoform X2 [Tarenaya hassleriana]|uniref:uncharacterized protein LOC104801463 isoform X2 n=1 Tax=Tarenaya hassleriana TaxID=28532 RepID=UPI00053C857A|nr:PREDICTED: uncharacterized protein LOC104801463 isoform X2 [Tarenaya hassleriana]